MKTAQAKLTPAQEYQIAQERREALQREINAYPIIVDRGSFQKTGLEKEQLISLKNRFKASGLFEWNERNRPGNNRK